MTGDQKGDFDIAYGIEEKPPVLESIPLGIQHVLAMILPNIAPAIVIAGGIEFVTPGQETTFIQMVLLFAGVATIVQAYPIGPIGGRLPIVMGTSFAFVGGAIGIGIQWGLPVLFGAIVAGALVEVGIGWQFKWFRKYFTPLVNGLIVVIIGLYLIPIGVDYLAGNVDVTDPSYGRPLYLGIGGMVFVGAILLNQLFKGYIRILSLLIAIIVGYIAAIAAGMVDFSPVTEAAWFAGPVPLRYGIEFKLVPILIMGMLYITTAMETVGHISAITAVEDRNPSDRELKGGLLADGVMSGIAGLFGGFPNTSFAQNVGVVTFTGIMSRFVVAIAGVVLVIMGFIPKVGALFSTIPYPVLGGATLVMFGMILSAGFKIIADNVTLNRRNMVIIAAAVGLGLGVAVKPEVLKHLPEQAQTFFGEAVVMTALVSLILDNLIPGKNNEQLNGETPAEDTDRAGHVPSSED